MIDKIKIKFHNKDIILDPNTEVKIRALPRSPIEMGKGLPEPLLCSDTQGKPIYGSDGYLHDDLFKLNLYSKGGNIQFNFPKIAQYGMNLHPVDKEEAENVINLLSDRLYLKGIRINLVTCEIKSLEIYKNLHLPHPYEHYRDALALLQIRRGFEKEFASSLYLGNKSRQIVIYNKTRQLIDTKSIKKETKSITGSLMRVEYRMKKALVVNRELGLNTVSDLIDNWNNLKILYQKSIGNFLYGFEQKALDKTQSFESEADVLKYFLYKYPNSGWSKYRSYYGSKAILEQWASINDLKATLSSYKQPAAVSRDVKALQIAAAEIAIKSDLSAIDLLEEFKSMLLD